MFSSLASVAMIDLVLKQFWLENLLIIYYFQQNQKKEKELLTKVSLKIITWVNRTFVFFLDILSGLTGSSLLLKLVFLFLSQILNGPNAFYFVCYWLFRLEKWIKRITRYVTFLGTVNDWFYFVGTNISVRYLDSS